jgi:hypothetical protein
LFVDGGFAQVLHTAYAAQACRVAGEAGEASCLTSLRAVIPAGHQSEWHDGEQKAKKQGGLDESKKR